MAGHNQNECDIFVIGGGINGTGIARDAAGRGLSVVLAEKEDLAAATSSASTKLFHGGLRYLEYFKLRLVREALIEREVLLRNMPHISWPMRFVLPISPDMRFESDTPTSRVLSLVMPWARGRRPAWLIRLGLFVYDHLGGRHILPATKRLNLQEDPAGKVLKPHLKLAYEYSDCWVDDARLVVLNAVDAKARGAKIMTRTEVTSLTRENGQWRVALLGPRGPQEIRARAVVNAAGPWVGDVLHRVARQKSEEAVRLVRGSHIILPKLYTHDQAYFFQGGDGRIIFALPYEGAFTLIGTTDEAHEHLADTPVCTDAERDYLLDFASQYFKTPLRAKDIVHRYSGVRPLFDDGSKSASAATRDYVLSLDCDGGAALLNVFGGKITTYRKLAEAALARLAPQFADMGGAWTRDAPLPGGDFGVRRVDAQIIALRARYPFLSLAWASRLFRAYGTRADQMLAGARDIADLGRHFGATLYEVELEWMQREEFATSGEDALWRRSKLGLHLTAAERAGVCAWFDRVTP